LRKRPPTSKGHLYIFSGLFMEVHDLQRELFQRAVMEALPSQSGDR
jgi:hypothetical protein